MIPKIIHYCWLSGKPYPPNIEKCMATWRKNLPGYEFRLWDFTRFPINKSAWVAEAYAEGKYAFAADYIRAYALYHEGGFYLDADVEVLRPFDSLLHLPYAFGLENGSGCIDAGIMASEPGNAIFKQLLGHYDRIGRFKNTDGSLNSKTMPRIMRDELRLAYKITVPENLDPCDYDSETLIVFPHQYFSPLHVETRKIEATAVTFAIHHFAGSWTKGWQKHRAAIKRAIGPNLTQLAIRIKRSFLNA